MQERTSTPEYLSGIEILDIANGRGDWVKPTKKYINCVFHAEDGSIRNNVTLNNVATLKHGKYTADNSEYSLKKTYERLLIRVRRMNDEQAEK